MLNIFALRSTDPAALYNIEDPVGPDNDASILANCYDAKDVVAAWGTHGAFNNRGAEVKAMLNKSGIKLQCLGKTKKGFPKHPLYLASSTALEEF